MPTFGRYEVVREIAVTSSGSVWTAKQGDSTPAVKTYQPPAGVVGEDQVARGVRAFLEAAAVQAKVATEGQHWAPIRETGEMPGGAYYVTNYYAQSAKKLIDGKVGLDAAGLYQIASGAADGLAEIRTACGRPHGNLKASNILLDGPPGARGTSVFLTDPADPSSVDAGAEANDLYALGQVLFELVTHRQAKRMMQWPIRSSPEWAQLTAKADAWRDLCNQLLHPVPEEGLRRLDDLRATLAELAVGGKRGRKPVIVGGAAAAVIVLSAASAAWFLHFGRRQQAVVPPVPPPTNNLLPVDSQSTDPATNNVITTPNTTLVDAEAQRKRLENWKARIAAPAVQSPALLKAWDKARERQLAGLTRPDPGVEARLAQLRDNLQALERDLSTVNAAGVVKAEDEREQLYAKAAAAVAADPSASDPTARLWRDLRDEYSTWLSRQGDVRRADELAEAAAAERAGGHDRAALNKLGEALDRDPTNPRATDLRRQIQEAQKAALAEASKLAVSRDHLDEALAKVNALLNRDPEYADAKALADWISSRLGTARANEALLKSAKEQVAQGNDGLALETLEKVLQREPGNPKALEAREQIAQDEARLSREATELDDRGDMKGAMDKLKELSKRNPGRADVAQARQDLAKKWARGLLVEARSKSDAGDWDGALLVLSQVDAISPRDVDALKLRGQVEIRIQNHQRVQLLLAAGKKLEKEEQWERAVAAYNDAAGLEPQNADVKARLDSAGRGLAAYRAKLLQQETVRTALALADKQLAADNPDGAEAALAEIDSGLKEVQSRRKAIQNKRDELDNRVIASARQKANAGDLDGAVVILAGFEKRREPQPAEAKKLLQEIQLKKAEREREAQAALEREAQNRAQQLREVAAAQLNAGNPDAALKVLDRAPNDRVRTLVKSFADDVRAKVARAPAENIQGMALFVQRKYPEAAAAFLRAAQGGYPEAMLHLGGLLVKNDPRAAAAWFQRSADLGNTDAMTNLADLYRQGIGVERNTAVADELYKRAAAAGNAAAKRYLASLKHAPTADEISHQITP